MPDNATLYPLLLTGHGWLTPDLRVSHWSQGLQQLTDLTAEQALNRPLAELLPDWPALQSLDPEQEWQLATSLDSPRGPLQWQLFRQVQPAPQAGWLLIAMRLPDWS